MQYIFIKSLLLTTWVNYFRIQFVRITAVEKQFWAAELRIELPLVAEEKAVPFLEEEVVAVHEEEVVLVFE